MSKDPAPTLGWEVIASGTAGPGARSRHCLAYDKLARRAVLFGGIIWDGHGTMRSDTWELQGTGWSWIRTADTPAARHRGAMVFLANLGESLLFGGQEDSGGFLGDTWIYAGRRWRRLAPGRANP